METIFNIITKILRYTAGVFSLLIFCSTAASEGWSLKRHSKDRNLTNKPALISYTDPKGKESSYTVDAALIYTFATQISDVDGKLVIEGHKNTQTKNESDVVSIGVAAEYPIDFNCDGVCDSVYIETALDIKKNQVLRSESVQLITDFKFYAPDLFIDSYKETSFGLFYWVPQFAIEIEDVIETDSGIEGHWIRFMSQIEIGFETDFKETTENKVKFYMVHTNWLDGSKSDRLEVESDSHSLRLIGITYPIAEKDDLKVSIDLTNVDGENIRTGTPNQEYTQFSIGVSF